ncbi:hypothetical protein [Pseudonocardia sp.]|nr:hypothetical protein [Pseudonocardia sp.]
MTAVVALLTAALTGAVLESVSIRVPLVSRPHVDLGRVCSAACPGSPQP